MNDTPKQIFHEFMIAGMRYYPWQNLNIQPQDFLELIVEPDNRFAKHPAGAIAVAKNGTKIGHVPEVDLEKIHPVVSACQCLVSYTDLNRKYPAVLVAVVV